MLVCVRCVLMYVCVCVCCVMINDFVCLCILRYDWCLCVFVCLLTSLSCRGWIGWLCRTALVNFQTTCLLPQLPSPNSNTSSSNSNNWSSNAQTYEHANILSHSSHLTHTSNWNTPSSNIWTFIHSTSRPHVFSPSSHLPAPLSHTHTSNSNTSSSNTQTFQFPTHHMSPRLLHRLKHVRLLMLL